LISSGTSSPSALPAALQSAQVTSSQSVVRVFAEVRPQYPAVDFGTTAHTRDVSGVDTRGTVDPSRAC
jgi:hypothetical protein